MKKYLLWSLVILAIVAITGAAVSAQKRKKCWYYCTPAKPRVVAKGCNACARLKLIEKRLDDLEAKKPEERTATDMSMYAILRKEFDDLLPRVVALEKDNEQNKADIAGLKTDVGQLRAETTGLRTDVNNTTVLVDELGVRVGKLEKPCYAIAAGDKLINSCTGQKIKTGGGENKIITWTDRGLQWFCILTGKCQIGGGRRRGGPPSVVTDPPTGGPPILPPGP